jgi:phytoene synthase
VAVAVTEQVPEDAARRASSSSFYAAMRIMPRHQRDAMFEIYAFCRAVDDVADDGGPRAKRLEELARWRADVEALYAGNPPARLRPLAVPIRRFGLERDDFLAIVDGMEMDVVSDIRAPAGDVLDLYCDRVASAVGRLSVKVFGMEHAAGIALAHHLGRALQLTNILRDLDEDAAIGRLYLPAEALHAAGIFTTDPAIAMIDPALGKACVPVVTRAREHFARADAVMRTAPRRAVRTPKIMAEAYKLKLAGLVARGWAAPRQPIQVSRPRLLWALIRSVVL